MICDYYIHETDLADLSSSKHVWEFSQQISKYLSPLESGNLQIVQTKFPVFSKKFQIPCVFPDGDFLKPISPVFPVQWVLCHLVLSKNWSRDYVSTRAIRTRSLKPIFHCNAKSLVLGFTLGNTPNQELCIGYTNRLVSKNTKICVTPNVSRWNIGCVGSPMQRAGGGLVDFILFVFISLALVTQHEPSFQWNMGYGIG